MTPNETSPDQAVEAVARLLCGGSDPDEMVQAGNPIGEPCDYPLWMLYQLDARKIIDTLAAIPTPPPADHTDLIARLEAVNGITPWRDVRALIIDAIEALQAHASPRELRLEAALRKIVAGNFNCSTHQYFMAAQGVAEDALTALELG